MKRFANVFQNGAFPGRPGRRGMVERCNSSAANGPAAGASAFSGAGAADSVTTARNKMARPVAGGGKNFIGREFEVAERARRTPRKIPCRRWQAEACEYRFQQASGPR